ncbi:MAG TPA: response regulator [Polyangia bacterium]|nr:response regulator [Polyangia bacterium]
MSNPPVAAGQEVLVVDADDQVVKGLDKLLTRVGLIVTGTHDPIRARDQLLNKFYAVALVDADTPTPGGGIELLQFARDKSPLTSVVIMTARKSYETVVKAFRAGAADVVLKEPDVVPYLRERVVEAATDIKATADRNSLLEEVAETHEEFLRRLRDVAREGLDLEDRVTGRTQDTGDDLGPVSVVLVDDDPKALEKLQGVLTSGAGWQFRAALTGGEALDVVTQERPQIVMVKEDLPDLPGSMVVHTVKSSAPDAVTLLYTPPGGSGRPGEVKLVDTNGTMNTIASYAEPGQLAAPLGEIKEALRAKSKERRYLQAFRQKHFEFLQRYNSIKHRLKEELDRRKKKTLG